MNKHERQNRLPAAPHSLAQGLAQQIEAALPEFPTQVMALEDAPPRAPLTKDEVRAILASLMLAMFLAALDQTIVATALPTIGRQFQASPACPGSLPPICSPPPRSRPCSAH